MLYSNHCRVQTCCSWKRLSLHLLQLAAAVASWRHPLPEQAVSGCMLPGRHLPSRRQHGCSTLADVVAAVRTALQ
jgi:hypothetical protein